MAPRNLLKSDLANGERDAQSEAIFSLRTTSYDYSEVEFLASRLTVRLGPLC